MSEGAVVAAGAVAPGGAGWLPGDQLASDSSTSRDAGPNNRSSGSPPRLDDPESWTELEGQVRAVVSRPSQAGGGGETVWTFRVERYDDAGNRVLFVPVEMQGFTFEGSIAEGDWIRLRGTLKRGTLKASEVENLTTRATVSAKRPPRMAVIVIGALFLALFVGVVVLIVVMVTRNSQGSPHRLQDSPVAVMAR
jgi:hypothetical protein